MMHVIDINAYIRSLQPRLTATTPVTVYIPGIYKAYDLYIPDNVIIQYID